MGVIVDGGLQFLHFGRNDHVVWAGEPRPYGWHPQGCPYGYNENMADDVTAQKLNLEDVGRHLEKLGYKVIKLWQPWRHVLGEVMFENEKLFLKLASTSGIGERTKNEARFNENCNSVWKKYTNSFRTPKIFDEGVYEGKYYFLSQFVFGKPLAEVKQENPDISEGDLTKAAEIAKDIINLTDYCLLPKDKEHLRKYWTDRIFAISGQWSLETKTKTKQLLQFIEERKNNIDVGMSHGDFTPWAIMKDDRKHYYLVDSEASQTGGLRFYDAAYFYHRVYTKMKRPDLAEIYLSKFKTLYGWTDEDQKAFEPVLASRIMGGYFDAERDNVTSLELNKKLEIKLLSS